MEISPGDGPSPRVERIAPSTLWDAVPPKILVAGAERVKLAALADHCRSLGADVCSAVDGAQALISFGREAPELVLLMDSLGGVSWQEVSVAIRADSWVPIILVVSGESVRTSWGRIGVTETVLSQDLLDSRSAILEQVLRNSLRRRSDLNTIVAGRLTMVMDAFEVAADGKQVALTLREFELLRLLMLNADKVVTTEQIQTGVWGAGEQVRTATIKVHIGRLRNKLSDAASLVAVRGVGYKLLSR